MRCVMGCCVSVMMGLVACDAAVGPDELLPAVSTPSTATVNAGEASPTLGEGDAGAITTDASMPDGGVVDRDAYVASDASPAAPPTASAPPPPPPPAPPPPPPPPPLTTIAGAWITPGTYQGNANGRLTFNDDGSGGDTMYFPTLYGTRPFRYARSGNTITITQGCAPATVFCFFYTGDHWTLSFQDASHVVLTGGVESNGVYSIASWRGNTMVFHR